MKIYGGLYLAFHQIWQHFLKALDESSEPKIWQTCDHEGHIYWQAYNPATGRSSSFGSEAEVISWVEQSYYQSRS